jgi:hypothetical protein
MHEERALCTGDAELRESASHGIGDSELAVLERSMRELSGVYG